MTIKRTSISLLLLSAVFAQRGDRLAPCMLSGVQQLTNMYRMVSKTTGNPALDRAITTEAANANRMFGVRADLFMVNDVGASNAYAMPNAQNPAWPDGTIAIGIQLLTEQLQESSQGITTMAIIAHEFGHVVQFKRRAPLSAYLMELQADYLAGWYMARRRIGKRPMDQVMQAFFQRGDTEFTEASWHPAPQMRTEAIQAGYTHFAADIEEAYRESLAYVTSHALSRSDNAQLTDPIMAKFREEVTSALRAIQQVGGLERYNADLLSRDDDEMLTDSMFNSRFSITGTKYCTASFLFDKEHRESTDSLDCRWPDFQDRGEAIKVMKIAQKSLEEIAPSRNQVKWRGQDHVSNLWDGKDLDSGGRQVSLKLTQQKRGTVLRISVTIGRNH